MAQRSHPPDRIEPAPWQESVWDYPRPPIVVPTDDLVRIIHAGTTVAETRRAVRVLETSQPPAYYLPRDDVSADLLVPSPSRSWCEWKGTASYWTLRLPDPTAPGIRELVVADVAWSYEAPTEPFLAIAGHLAFYAQRVDECWVGPSRADGEEAELERVEPNPGAFYGGWITSRVVGPFKGGPGSQGW